MMKRTKIRMGICIALLAALLGFIWGNSSLPAEESSQVSGGMLELLLKIVPFLTEHALRKLAHFSEFAALGLCLCWLFGMLEKKVWCPIACGVAVACVDECIQLFSAGRSSSVLDVALDSAGVLTGVALLLLICKIRKTRCC